MRLGIGLELYGKDTNSWVSSFLEGNLESETKKEKTNDKAKEEVKQAQELIDNAENNLNELIGDYKAEGTK